MTPFVIDNQVRRRYILIFALLLTVSFALGYISGFYMGLLDKVEAEASVASETPSELVEPSPQDEQTPEATEKSDTSPKPEVKSEVSPPVKIEKNTVTALPQKTTKPIPAPAPVSQIKEIPKTPEKKVAEIKQEPVKPVPQHAIADVKKINEPEPEVAVQASVKPEQSSTDKAEELSMVVDGNTNVFQESQRMFSVQVGVFANRENALNLVEELKNGGFDAYLDDFVASGGEVKYNVRFGRESDRSLIQQQLAKYKQQFSTSAYIIISK